MPKLKWQYIKGEKSQHLFDFMRGYPIRVCRWEWKLADLLTTNTEKPHCKNCELYLQGKRRICFAPMNPVVEEV